MPQGFVCSRNLGSHHRPTDRDGVDIVGIGTCNYPRKRGASRLPLRHFHQEENIESLTSSTEPSVEVEGVTRDSLSESGSLVIVVHTKDVPDGNLLDPSPV